MIKDEHYAKIAEMVAECQATGRACLLVTVEDTFTEEAEISRLQLYTATHSGWETKGMVETLRSDYGIVNCVYVTNMAPESEEGGPL